MKTKLLPMRFISILFCSVTALLHLQTAFGQIKNPVAIKSARNARVEVDPWQVGTVNYTYQSKVCLRGQLSYFDFTRDFTLPFVYEEHTYNDRYTIEFFNGSAWVPANGVIGNVQSQTGNNVSSNGVRIGYLLLEKDITYTTPGTFSVRIASYQINSTAPCNSPNTRCSADDGKLISVSPTYTVVVGEPFTASIASLDAEGSVKDGPIAICEGGSLTLGAFPAGLNYVWNVNSVGQTIEASETGIYAVTVTDPSSTCSASSFVSITKSPNPVAQIVAESEGAIVSTRPVVLCEGKSATLRARPLNMTYLWNDNTTQRALSVSSTGTYSVIVTDPATGCSAPAAARVRFIPNPKPVISSESSSICEGSSTILTSSEASQYFWNTEEVSGSIEVSTAGAYTVTVVNENGCTATSDLFEVTVSSYPVASILDQDTLQGVWVEYFEGRFDTILPNFNSLNPNRTKAVANFNLNEVREREYYYAARFVSYLSITTAGNYTFYLNSDDGSRLYIDEQLVVDLDGNHGPKVSSGTVSLTEGKHLIKVEYFENKRGEVLEVSYEGPGVTKQKISNEVLILPAAICGNDRLTVTASPASSYVWSNGATTNSISARPGIYTVTLSNEGCAATTLPFYIGDKTSRPPVHRTPVDAKVYRGQWNDQMPDFTNLTPEFTVPVRNFDYTVSRVEENYAVLFTSYIKIAIEGNYTFYTSADDRSRLYVNNQLVVDNPDGWTDYLPRSGSIYLTEGKHPITVQYSQGILGFFLKAEYEGPGVNRQIIPTTALSYSLNNEARLTVPYGATFAWSTGETTSSIVTSTPGNYSVLITNEHGCTFTRNHRLGGGAFKIGVDEDDVASSEIVSVFPNPATDYIEVNTKGLSTLNKVVLSNMIGETVIEKVYNGNTGSDRIEVKGVSKGMYLLQVFTGKDKYETKVVIK